MHLNAAFCSVLLALVVALVPCGAQSEQIKVIAANALKDGYVEIVTAFEKSTGHKVATTWAGTVSATKRVSEGEIYDLVIIGSNNIDQLIAAGKLAAGSRADFAVTGIGMAIRAGLPRPDVSSSEAVKAAVLAADSIVYSAGPSGIHIGDLLKKMGIAEQIAAKVKQPSSGAEVASILARGEAAFGFAQVSEFVNVPGLTDLGPLPASIQSLTIYSIGMHVAAPSPESSKALVKHLKAPDAAPAIRKMGMEPG